MKVETFDKEVAGALKDLGFEIADDNASAIIGELVKIGDKDKQQALAVEIIQPSGKKDFLLTITFPNGKELLCTARRSNIVQSEE
jgi:hypothetical protein